MLGVARKSSYTPEYYSDKTMILKADTMPGKTAIATQTQPSIELTRLANKLKQEGQKLVNIGPGQPDFPPPREAQEALALSASDPTSSMYCPTEGLHELRSKIAERVNLRAGTEIYGSENVIVTNGSQMALSLATSAVLAPGSTMLAPDPYFPAYRQLASIHSATFETYRVRMPGVMEDPLELAGQSDSLALIMINSPSNPTGAVLQTDELSAIADLSARHDAWVVSDEVYDDFIYSDASPVVTAAQNEDLRPRLVLTNSFSKGFGMAGWRLGYVVAPKKLIPVLKYLHQYSGRAASRPVQLAGIAALSAPQAWLNNNRQEYARRRDWLIKRIDAIESVSASRPEGGFYICADIRNVCADDIAFCEQLLRDFGVQASPGTQYGQAMKSWIRLSFATEIPRLEMGMDRLEALVDSMRHGERSAIP
jgi:aspartate aminotransferase